jgi:hypothetical protein
MALELRCPAALPLPLAVDFALPGCRCGVIRRANEGEDVGGWTVKGQVGEIVDPVDDPSTIVAFCAGQGIPSAPTPGEIYDEIAGALTPTRANEVFCYTDCPVWVAEKHRLWAGRAVKGGLQAVGAQRDEGRDRPERQAALHALRGGDGGAAARAFARGMVA